MGATTGPPRKVPTFAISKVGVGVGVAVGAVPLAGKRARPVVIGPAPRPTGRMPRPLFVPKVKYPPKARQAGLEGAVLLSVEVKANGRVGQVKVIKGAHPLLDKAAVSAFRRARFKPATNKAGKPIRFVIPRYRYVFQLEK